MTQDKQTLYHAEKKNVMVRKDSCHEPLKRKAEELSIPIYELVEYLVEHKMDNITEHDVQHLRRK